MTESNQNTLPDPNARASLARALEQELFDRHGPMIADEALRIALGYRSMEAFRQAMSRKTLPVPVFSPPHRRGKYALVKDVALWLATLQYEAAGHSDPPDDDQAQPGQEETPT